MPPIRTDMSHVNENTVLPAGDVLAYVFKIDYKETGPNSKTPGTPMLLVTYKTKDTGEFVFDNVVLGEKSLWRWQEFLIACGYSKEDASSSDLEVETDDLIGTEVLLTLTIQAATDQYAESNRVKKIRNPEGALVTSGTSW